MFYFIWGLFWGSFLNNVAYRLVRKEDFIYTKSKCPSCGKILKWYELIPLVSFIIQRGRCRACNNRISLRYPITELITGLFTYGCALKSGLLVNLNFYNFLLFLYILFFFSILFILALYDLETFYIEEKTLYFGLIVWLIFAIVFSFIKIPEFTLTNGFNYFFNLPLKQAKFSFMLNSLFRGFIFSIFILLLFVFTLGKGIGLGDLKIVFFSALFLNFGDMIALILLSSFLGSVIGVYKILKNRKFFNEIPFIPLVFASAFILLFLGEYLFYQFNNFMIKLS